MDLLSLIPAFGGLIWILVSFIVALSVIVAIHEYGHYIVGRWSGIHADVFSIGFGPVLWSRHDKRGTRWQIAALPFGGYVKFAGDANAASGKDEEAMEAASDDPDALRRTMHGAPLWARAATVTAGPVFNFILSILVFSMIGYSTGIISDPLTVGELRPLPNETNELRSGDVVLEIDGNPLPDRDDQNYSSFFSALPMTADLEYTVEREGTRIVVQGPHYQSPLIHTVAPQSAAISAGLESGDVIVAIDDVTINTFPEIKAAVESSNGRPLKLGVWRNGEVLEKTLKPLPANILTEDDGFQTVWRIGIASGAPFDGAREAPGVGQALSGGVRQTWAVIDGTFSFLGGMIAGQVSTCNLSGPIGIAQTAGQMASQGTTSFIWLIALLSTAVGLMNLFPIPALDGGHLVFYAYEAVTGRPPSDAALRILMTFGFAMILMLMILATVTDLFCP
ncbi:MAG: RIP metalloprotease RseP [Paracoccaceae bacterium]